RVLHRNAERPSIWRGRQRKRMRLPPTVTGQEPPEEELTRPSTQPVEVTAGNAHRDDVLVLSSDLDNSHTEPPGSQHRLNEPEQHDQRQGNEVQRRPVRGCRAVDGELVAGWNLVI